MAKRKKKAARPAAGSDKIPEEELSSGTRLPLDGDLVFLIDTLYRDFARNHGFAPDLALVQRELHRVLDQMDAEAAREYFTQSLFLNYVTYENEMAERLAEQLTSKGKGKAKKKARRAGRGH